MVESVDEDLMRDGFERVYVETSWYDGPRGGVADVSGVAHYFRAVHDYYQVDEPDEEYFVWPAGAAALAMEREQWAIFVDWNARCKAGTSSANSHPGKGGIDARYDELEAFLASHRVMPDDARRLVGEWHSRAGALGYHADGPGYLVRWRSDR